MWFALVTLVFMGFTSCGVRAQDDFSIKNYEGYKVYNLTINCNKKKHHVRKFDGLDGYDFWLYPMDGFAHLMVAPENQYFFELDMLKHHIDFSILNEDVATALEKEYQGNYGVFRAFETIGPYDFTYFPRYHEIKHFIKSVVKDRKYSRVITIGESFEGRPIYAVEVMKSPEKPVFFIDAGIHAREWAAHVAALYIIQKIVNSEKIFAEMMSFVIVPCLNPDGYEYSHNTDRLWRKTMSQYGNSECKGVDLNRNFDASWSFTTRDTCSETYGGPIPFSEAESKSLRDAVLKYRPIAYITIHSFGPMLLYPFGYSKDLPPNWRVLDDIANKIAKNIKKVNGTSYVTGTAARVLYESSGGSDDWAYLKAGVPIVYTMELPQFENQAFILKKKYIKPMVKETFVGFVTLIQNVYKLFGDA